MSEANERMSYRDLRELVELINSCSQFGEFHLKLGDLEIELRRVGTGAPAQAAPTPPAAPAPQAPTQAPTQPPTLEPQARTQASQAAPQQRHGHVGGGEVTLEPADSPAAAASHATHPAATSYPPGSVLVTSPMVGIFYRAPEPGARPFVEVGQAVDAETTVCIIEVMKLMNSIPAAAAGTVTHVLVGDGEPVEYGQVLMVVAPAEAA